MAFASGFHQDTGHSMRAEVKVPDAPSIDANEITDKGYVNQRLALDRRSTAVEQLFAPVPDKDVIVIERQVAHRRSRRSAPAEPPARPQTF
jgi:feruloyl-CoA synthase